MYQAMSFRNLLLGFLFILSGGYSLMLVAADITPEQQEAGLVVSQYMQGLIDGNTGQIANSLSQELWAERKDYVDKASYGDSLRRRYQGATFEVLEYQTMPSNDVEAVVKLVFSGGHEKTMRFMLRSNPSNPYPAFRIIEEKR
jgi:hypothetical protein